MVLEINEKLNSYSFNPFTTILTRSSDDENISRLISRMNNGDVGALIMSGVNPIYSLPDSKKFSEGLSKVDMSICFSMKNDETALASKYVAAANHFLESWGDFELVSGEFSLAQPVIRTLFDTRQFQDLLLIWSGNKTSTHDYIKNYWKANILGLDSWNKALHDGIYYKTSSLGLAKRIKNFKHYGKTFTINDSNSSNSFELNIYPKTGMGDGKHANNPWLQEFPDPLTEQLGITI